MGSSTQYLYQYIVLYNIAIVNYDYRRKIKNRKKKRVRTHKNRQNQTLSAPLYAVVGIWLDLPLCVCTFYIFTPLFPSPPSPTLLINSYSDSSFRHSQFLGYFHFYLFLRLNFTKPQSQETERQKQFFLSVSCDYD